MLMERTFFRTIQNVCAWATGVSGAPSRAWYSCLFKNRRPLNVEFLGLSIQFCECYRHLGRRKGCDPIEGEQWARLQTPPFYVEVLPNPLFVASPIHNRLSKPWLAVCRPLLDHAYFPRCSMFGCSYSAHSITMWLAIVTNHLRLGTVVVSETHYLRLIKHTLGTDSLPEVHNMSRILRGNT